jgi:hypothetical protein
VRAQRCVGFPCQHAFRVQCLARALPPHERERLAERGQEALEDALGAECPLCGDAMVESVSKPFIDPVAESALVHSWLVT